MPAVVIQELDETVAPAISDVVQEVGSRLVDGQTEAHTIVVGLTAPSTHDALPGCVANTSDWNFFQLAIGTEQQDFAPTGAGAIQVDDFAVSRMMACHRRGRSMGDELESHSTSSDREMVASPPRRVVTRSRRYQRSTRRSGHMLILASVLG
ncbi:UNVERIFIED_CONTAM: hypothetical protein Slati_2859700 [Sesamum latifolium]|uniref:Uncharacterized protein n=1 Tax=Sesamum latifolium TaxID=2727402 RepID=A0AAW2VAQ8_9LAMI